MDDRYEDVVKQYDLKVYHTYRARGAFLLDTDQGLKLYRNYEGSENRAEFENTVKLHAYKNGYRNVDLYLKNNKEELVSMDLSGNRYVVRDWFSGEECNLRELNCIIGASANLAKLHKVMRNIPLLPEQPYIKNSHVLTSLFDKRNRELKRVKSYIRDKKQKNEFEICFLNCYDEFYEQGKEALNILENSDYAGKMREAEDKTYICHGNYTYHNVLILKNDIATTNFEKSYIGIQVMDLYQLLRKTMEKNDWNHNFGSVIIEEYNKYHSISKGEMKILYVMLLYPEKFWKITNFYFNGKKSWVPQRNIQKLISIQEQSEPKDSFLRFFVKEYHIL